MKCVAFGELLFGLSYIKAYTMVTQERFPLSHDI